MTPLLKDYVLNFPSPEDTEPEFISLKPGVATNLPEKTSEKKTGVTDFDYERAAPATVWVFSTVTSVCALSGNGSKRVR